jgi:DNA-binding NarL/FixJ family response regulator
VIRRLRATKNPCAVIVFTSHVVPALKVAAFEAGADYFLDKSKDFITLRNLLREIAGERAA